MHHLYLHDNPEKPKSFEYVWITLINELKIPPIQAEQCCLIAKERGKCHLKQGDIIELVQTREALEKKGLTITMVEKSEV